MRNPLVNEFDDVDLGDERLNTRAARILDRWFAAPAASFPKVVSGSAELQALYGFMENEAIDFQALIDAHAGKTCQRIRDWSLPTVLVIHDTTTCTFPGEIHRDGLGWVTSTKQGFHGHFSLAVSADESRCPLGVVALSIITPVHPHTKDPKRGKRNAKQCSEDPERDTRWLGGVEASRARLHGVAIPIHITDRAGDGYEFIGSMVASNQRFVVRSNFDRRVSSADDGFVEKTKLRTVAERAVPVSEREIQLSRRRASKLPDANKKHAPRNARSAKLEFAAGTVRVTRTRHLQGLPETIDLHFVHVREIDTPAGKEPVDWLLLTSEPIDTPDDVLRIVDYYRARWTIEEFFKAIKTGCRYEERQLESADALLIALGICIPIAWQMLALRHQSRHRPNRPAAHVIDRGRLDVLIAISPLRLSAEPTVEDVCYAIAALGGHIRRNGPPGWHTLRDGMDRLLLAEQGWNARAAAEKM